MERVRVIYFTEYDTDDTPIRFQLYASGEDNCICDADGKPVCMLPKGQAINGEKLVSLWKEQQENGD